MYYQITEDVDYAEQFDETPTIMIGNENAVLDFVNERNDEAEDKYTTIEEAKKWLNDNGYELDILKNFIERLDRGDKIFIQ